MNIVFIRHGEAYPRKGFEDSAKDDLERKLTEKGRGQVPTNLGEFDIVVSSPAERAKETARIASGGKEPAIINSLSTHLWDGDWESVDHMFVNRKGKQSLEQVYESASVEERWAGRVITDAAFFSLDKLAKECVNKNPRILVAGHAVFLPALLMKCVEEYKDMFGGCNDREYAEKVVMKEAEVFSFINGCLRPGVFHIQGRGITSFPR